MVGVRMSFHVVFDVLALFPWGFLMNLCPVPRDAEEVQGPSQQDRYMPLSLLWLLVAYSDHPSLVPSLLSDLLHPSSGLQEAVSESSVVLIWLLVVRIPLVIASSTGCMHSAAPCTWGSSRWENLCNHSSSLNCSFRVFKGLPCASMSCLH